MIKNINELSKRVEILEAKMEEQNDFIERLNDRIRDLECTETYDLPFGPEGQDD